MATQSQIGGLLLEEVILALLRAAGYRTVTKPGSDPTLSMGPAGIVVAGRGTGHQVDAIADFRVAQAFSNPQRLLIEAKFYARHRPVSLPIVRSAVGVLKDVSEFWFRPDARKPAARRYHYQAAIFSASDFTVDAQDYAFAHDVYLLPLRGSAFFSPILDAISTSVSGLATTSDRQALHVDLTDLRRYVRRSLQPNLDIGPQIETVYEWVQPAIVAANEVGRALVGMVGRAFPVLLTPRPGLDVVNLQTSNSVEIHFERPNAGTGWELTTPGGRERLFTFDLPPDLFDLYATDGVLSPERAVDLKEGHLNEIQAVAATDDSLRLLTFRLSGNWLASVRETLNRRRG